MCLGLPTIVLVCACDLSVNIHFIAHFGLDSNKVEGHSIIGYDGQFGFCFQDSRKALRDFSRE